MNGGEGGLAGPTLEAGITAFLHWALPAAALLVAIFFMRALGRWREAEEWRMRTYRRLRAAARRGDFGVGVTVTGPNPLVVWPRPLNTVALQGDRGREAVRVASGSEAVVFAVPGGVEIRQRQAKRARLGGGVGHRPGYGAGRRGDRDSRMRSRPSSYARAG